MKMAISAFWYQKGILIVFESTGNMCRIHLFKNSLLVPVQIL